ncbi:sensor histidine kinase [Frankia sp. AgB32]|uniref:sensor histidine kinase n=1 Tax=Frankia sp. AgB32 TaxID=631119 RepID=UPI00200EA90C|nr:sensor histidine kinase [Frankia sp. AgB32]MCK9895110.1 sensor histidine kinase [Frankia sp. AgB32]
MPHPRLPDRLSACAAKHRSLCLAVSGSVTAALSIACEWRSFGPSPFAASVNVAVALAFVLTAAMLNGEETLGSVTGALALGGLLWPLSWTAGWETGPSALLSTFAYSHFWICIGWGVLRYPTGRLRNNGERALLAAAVLIIPLASLGLIGISRPAWFGYRENSDVWWYGSPIDIGTFHLVVDVLDVLTVALSVLFLLVVRNRLRRYSELDRRIFRPVALALLVAFLIAATINAVAYNPSSPYIGPEFAAVSLTLLTIPLAFAAAVLRRVFVRARIAQQLATLPNPPTVGAVQSALRNALDDDSAEILLWLPEEEHHVDATGTTRRPPGPHAADVITELRTSTGSPLAMIIAAPAMRRNRDLVTAAVQTCVLALENARLHATVAAQLDAVRSSRARLVEAGLHERRRLERDLHDGAQQRLLALATRLGLARTKATDPDTISAIDAAREDLRHALADLRSLARGIHPAQLSQGGLRPALEAVTNTLPLDVGLDVTTERFSAVLEAGVYYTICEALTNTVKHAGAAHAVVTVSRVGEVVRAVVADDGKGGATTVDGGGLAGLTDRVRALGGTLEITSPSGGGTRLVADIPCDPPATASSGWSGTAVTAPRVRHVVPLDEGGIDPCG